MPVRHQTRAAKACTLVHAASWELSPAGHQCALAGQFAEQWPQTLMQV